MRKLIPLVLLSVLFVSGCKPSSQKKKKSSNEETSLITSNNPGTSVTSAQTSNVSPTSSSTVEPSTSEKEPPVPGTIITKTIDFIDDFRANSGFTAAGQQIDTDLLQPTNNKTKNALKLKTYLETICSEVGMVDDIVFHNLNTIAPKQEEANVFFLTFGSASAAGSMEWKSVASMTKVELVVNNYYKYYKTDYTDPSAVAECHTDNAQVSINDVKTPMSVADTTIHPTSTKVVYEPANPFTSFLITNDLVGETTSNRIFIESMTITWQF